MYNSCFKVLVCYFQHLGHVSNNYLLFMIMDYVFLFLFAAKIFPYLFILLTQNTKSLKK